VTINDSRPALVACPDSFKGTCSAHEVARAVARAGADAGWSTDVCPMSDGGEGFASVLETLGGELRSAEVTGPLGSTVKAHWRHVGELAVIESAEASGLVLAGGAAGNDPVRATSRGTGELITSAISDGARQVLVGVGGSATTDGGVGAVQALSEAGGFGGAEVVVAADTRVKFSEAAAIYAPQKGATPDQVRFLSDRLIELVEEYEKAYGMNVDTVVGSGAAGGLAGGLAVLGATIRPGFEVVSDAVGLAARASRAQLLVTGEGRVDATSWTGKVVGGVEGLAASLRIPLLVVAGRVDWDSAVPDAASGSPAPVRTLSLSELFGDERSVGDTTSCVTEAVRLELDRWGSEPTDELGRGAG